jgi:broad specificity phosphatase PhoE
MDNESALPPFTSERAQIIMARMKKTAVYLLLALAATSAAAQSLGLDVYLTRHAETMGNVTGDYSETNQCTFSPKGLGQVAGITAKLDGYHFDAVVVSPTWRTRQTILPYLKARGLTAEIWPELEECCCGAPGDAPPATTIPLGENVVINEEDAAHFKLRDETAAVRYAPTTEAEGMAQMRKAGELIRSRFGGSGQSVLIVTHSCSGARIIEDLLGLKLAGRFPVDNASVTHLRQEGDTFQLLALNDKPFQPEYSWKPASADIPRPGTPLVFSLAPRYFVPDAVVPSRVAWRVLDARGQVVQEDSKAIPVGAREASRVLDLAIPTEGAALGDIWTLESSVYSGETVTRQWTNRFLFPSYFPLSGAWRIHAGDEASWGASDIADADWATTSVPGGWEKDALSNYDGIAWSRFRFAVPEDVSQLWGDAPLAVVLGAVDDADETFLNGQRIGAAGEFPPAKVTAWDQPRIYEFDRSLLGATNVLAVRCSDWGGGGGIWKGPVAIGPVAELRTAAELAK